MFRLASLRRKQSGAWGSRKAVPEDIQDEHRPLYEARVEPEGATLVAYATKDGQVAQDGDGANSPFATALVRYIETPGLEINFLFRRVRDDVLNATGRRQEPFVYGSLPAAEFYFRLTLSFF